jgi:hypothetical protein
VCCHTAKQAKMTTFKKHLFTIKFLISATTVAAQSHDSLPLIRRPADFGLVYPISTNGTAAAKYSNTISIQGLAGVSGEVTAAAVAGLGNIVKGDAGGTAVAGLANAIGGRATGTQVAGLVNRVAGEGKGAEIAGILNTSGNYAGAQVAGIANISRGSVTGIQIAGLVNRSGEATSQIAGLLNRATRVKGVQLSGLVNIADSSDYPIGFINLIGNGDKSLGVLTDESLNTIAFFRSGGRVLYGIIGIGYNLGSSRHLYELETGIGAHLLPSGQRVRLNAEAASITITDFSHGHAYKYALRALGEIQLSPRVSVFAGPSANLVLDYAHGSIASVFPHFLWTTTGKNGHPIGAYVGATGGVSLSL